MKKSDLKTGMRVITSFGMEYLVFINVETDFTRCTTKVRRDFIVNTKGEFVWNGLNNYDENLFHINNSKDNIDQVYSCSHPYSFTRVNDDEYKGNLLWERKPEKIHIIDGIEYSESSLISIIKKAHK